MVEQGAHNAKGVRSIRAAGRDRLHRLTVKTTDCRSVNWGSIPHAVAKLRGNMNHDFVLLAYTFLRRWSYAIRVDSVNIGLLRQVIVHENTKRKKKLEKTFDNYLKEATGLDDFVGLGDIVDVRLPRNMDDTYFRQIFGHPRW